MNYIKLSDFTAPFSPENHSFMPGDHVRIRWLDCHSDPIDMAHTIGATATVTHISNDGCISVQLDRQYHRFPPIDEREYGENWYYLASSLEKINE